MMFFKRNKLTSNDNTPANRAPASLIAAGMVIEGNVSSEGEIQVEGTVRGTIDAGVCVVGTEGLVEGTIRAEEVIVAGRVLGPIHAIHVELQDGAHVEGDLMNSTISVQNGAHLQGAVWHTEDPLGGGARDEPRANHASNGFLGAPLWPDRDDDVFRPVKTIKPR